MESHISAFALAIVSILVIQSIAFARGAMGVVVDEQGAFEAGNNYIDLNGDTVDELDHLVLSSRLRDWGAGNIRIISMT